MPTVAFNICCPKDCVSRHNGGTAGAPLKPLRVDSALRALSSLRGSRGAPYGSPIMPRDAVSRTANVERNGGHKWVKFNTLKYLAMACSRSDSLSAITASHRWQGVSALNVA